MLTVPFALEFPKTVKVTTILSWKVSFIYYLAKGVAPKTAP